MAKKLLNPLEDPATASSSDDDEVETSSGEDEEEQISVSSSEEDEPKTPAKTPSTKTLKTLSAASAKLDSGSEKESDSNSEPAEKPIVVTTAKSKRKEGDDLPAVKSGKKQPRPSEATTSKDMHVKRSKQVSRDNEKKPSSQRLWSEEDEVSLLEGMIDLLAETGKSPFDDTNGFYDVAKKCLSFEPSKIQFSDKIRKLKGKYVGNDKSFLKPHEKTCFGLAKFIWGSDGMALDSGVKPPVISNKSGRKKKPDSVEDKEVLGSDGIAHESAVVKSNVKVKKVDKSLKPEGDKVEEGKDVVIPGGDPESPNSFEKSFLLRIMASLGVDEYSLKQKWSQVPVETKKRIEARLKLVEAQEYELLSKKTAVLNEVTSVFCEAI